MEVGVVKLGVHGCCTAAGAAPEITVAASTGASTGGILVYVIN